MTYTAAVVLAADVLRYTGEWALRLGSDWKMEVPMRIHGRDSDGRWTADDGTPAFSAEFERWLERSRTDSEVRDSRGPYQNHPRRIRATRAMRKLRNAAPREWLVLWDLSVLNPVSAIDELPTAFRLIARRLNERAERKGYPERYTPESVEILAYSGISKLAERWL
jgi:hypothetical protein